jgi:hypothetical protein
MPTGEMIIDRHHCESLLMEADHGILGTVHARRGVDAVPVCFAVGHATVAVPIDTVKSKHSTDLQRVTNLDVDSRAVLLCEHWDPLDWSQLWWVRAFMARVELDANPRARLEDQLVEKYPQYRDRPFAGLLTFRITELDGWSGRSGSDDV